MRPKSRFLRILLVLLFLAGFVGFFAFQTFLFPPLEGDLKADIASLIPRNADFYLSKARLSDLFSDFPELAVAEELATNDAWETFTESEEYVRFSREAKLTESLAALRDLQDRIPLGMSLPQIAGGEDLALAGWFRGPNLAQADWAVYARVNWAGKLAVSALQYPGVLGLEKQGLVAEHDAGRFTLSGGQLARPLHLRRIRDVVVCATTAETADAALDLYQRKGQDSLFQSALYFDHVENHPARPREKDDIEFIFDTRAYFEATQTSANWPDAGSQDMGPRLLAKYFQLNSVKQVTGVMDFDDGVSIDVYGEFSSELITPLQSRLYRTRGFDRAQVEDVARLAPSDSALFVYLQGSVGDLLLQVLETMEPAMRANIDDAFKETDQFDGIDDVVDRLGTSLKNRLALIVRKNDYPPEVGGPPHNDDPVPAVAIVAWMENEKKVVEVRDGIGLNGRTFGMRGRSPGQSGYYEHSEGGFETREFWSEFVPGTGVIATMNASDVFVVSNSYQMLGHLAKTYFAAERPSLQSRPDFRALLQSGLARANALVWIDPKSMSGVLREQAQRWAENNVPGIDWARERPRIEGEVLGELFPGRQRTALKPEEEQQLEDESQRRVEAVSTEHFQQQYHRLMAESERRLTYLEASTGMLAMLSLDPKFFEIAVRVVAPVDPRAPN